MKKGNRITIVLIIVLIGLLGFKIYNIYKYKVDKLDINKNEIFNSTITIKHKDNKKSKTFEEMSYGNFFSGYEKLEVSDFYVKRDNDNKVISSYAMKKGEQYINMLSENSFRLYEEDKPINYNDISTEKELKEYLDNKKVTNDIELLEFVKNNYYFNNNIFTPTAQMRNNYLLNSFVTSTLPMFNSITLIKGDLNGYILNIAPPSKIRGIHLLYKNQQYAITLLGDELITDEFVTKFLESVSFE